MKHRLVPLFSLIATGLLASSAFASDRASIAFPPQPSAAPSAPTRQVGQRVEIGHARDTVLNKLGHPTSQLSTNGWVYENVELSVNDETQPKYKHLVVVFANDKVVSITVVSERGRQNLIAQSAREAAASAPLMARVP